MKPEYLKRQRERYKIAEKIVRTAETYGIPKEDIIIDCLVLTAQPNRS